MSSFKSHVRLLLFCMSVSLSIISLEASVQYNLDVIINRSREEVKTRQMGSSLPSLKLLRVCSHLAHLPSDEKQKKILQN